MTTINDKRNTCTELTSLKEGDCFLYGTELYMVTDNNDGLTASAVNLSTGRTDNFSLEDFITEVDIEINVK